MTTSLESTFKQDYHKHLQHLKLKGLQPKTIDAYSRSIRRIGQYFDYQINSLSEQQLVDYFVDVQESLSWSAVKLDLYGLKFYYQYVLRKPWMPVDLVKPPRAARLPDIVTVDGLDHRSAHPLPRRRPATGHAVTHISQDSHGDTEARRRQKKHNSLRPDPRC